MRREGWSRAGVPFRRFTRRQALGAMTGLLGRKALERNYLKNSAPGLRAFRLEQSLLRDAACRKFKR